MQTLRVIDKLAEGHDQILKSWKASVEREHTTESRHPPPVTPQTQLIPQMDITPLSADIGSLSSSHNSSDNEKESLQQSEGNDKNNSIRIQCQLD